MWSVQKSQNPRVSVYASVALALIGLGAAFALAGASATLSGAFVIGVLSWSFFEYLFHRFLLHVPVGIGKWDYLTVVVHKDHHETPYRLERVTAPLGVSIPAYVLFVGVIWLLTRNLALAFAWTGGLAAGYALYEELHIRLHAPGGKSRAFLYLRRYHFEHHFKDNTRKFGVTSPLWDWVFRTL